jgi:hypothetical protein
MMWTKHSRRIDPISRSTKPFCQGEAGVVGLSRMLRSAEMVLELKTINMTVSSLV